MSFMKKRDDFYLREIEDRIREIQSHLQKITPSKFARSTLHKSAVVRELGVIGEAANKVSSETKERFPGIPWDQMIGMRNRLIHGYFDIDYSIVWDVAKKELPKLSAQINDAILETAPPIHRWRLCPAGYYDVRSHSREVHQSRKNPDGVTSVREHCRRYPSGKDQLYPNEVRQIIEVASADDSLGSVGQLDRPLTANQFDREILIWTKYWNDLLSTDLPLDPNIIKALVGSESSFNPKVRDTHVRGKNYARGLFQVTDETRRILGNEKGELKDHYLTLNKDEVKEPAIGAAASIRWLFHKRELASKYLGRRATWEEAVADYKGYLRIKRKPWQTQKGMKDFNRWYEELRKK